MEGKYCDNCICNRCSNLKLPDQNVCDVCDISRPNKLLAEYMYGTSPCKYQECTNYVIHGEYYGSGYCTTHTCIINKCQQIVSTKMTVRRHTVPNYLCDDHHIWKVDHHLSYPTYFQTIIMTLLLILKRNENKYKVPKFIKYEIIKRTLLIY